MQIVKKTFDKNKTKCKQQKQVSCMCMMHAVHAAKVALLPCSKHRKSCSCCQLCNSKTYKLNTMAQIAKCKINLAMHRGLATASLAGNLNGILEIFANNLLLWIFIQQIIYNFMIFQIFLLGTHKRLPLPMSSSSQT